MDDTYRDELILWLRNMLLDESTVRKLTLQELKRLLEDVAYAVDEYDPTPFHSYDLPGRD